jgi:thioredoxin-related protein
MVQIDLTSEEAGMLREILTENLGDLRMEIAGTENMTFREELKRKEEFLKKLIQQLEVKSS